MINTAAREVERTQASTPAPPRRVVSIDILRGLAILWVIVYHLYIDMTLKLDDTLFFVPLRDHLLHGQLLPALTNAGESIAITGYNGVAMFMMLSGVSLTMNAYLRGEPSPLRGYASRIPRILRTYWAGIAVILASVAAVACLQALFDGGSVAHQWWNVRLAEYGRVRIAWRDVFEALSVFGWIHRARLGAAPASVGPLWFVELIVGYYLIFPYLLRIERTTGPWLFALGAIAATLLARSALVLEAQDALGVTPTANYLRFFVPFRLSEFAIGMSLGHLLAINRAQVAGWTRGWSDGLGMAVLGIALLVLGILMPVRGDGQFIVSAVVVQLGLALVMVPWLFKEPGRLESSLPSRALVALGIVSFTALIMNEMMRYVASFLRYEGVPSVAWWFFLVVVYVPVGTALAYPLARWLRLLPSQRVRARPADAAART